jgi:plastocyanin
MRTFATDRRQLLKATGATIAASFVAGCNDSPTEPENPDPEERTPQQIATDYVSGETAEHSGAANFSSSDDIVDETGSGEVTIVNGARSGGKFVFDPAVVMVDSGTTVTWNWKTGPHSVTPIDGAGATITGWQGKGGSAGASQGTQHTVTFDSAGVALYYCEPHFNQGQSGAVIVQ